MATYEVQGPKGEVYQIEGPDNANPADVVSQLSGGKLDQPQNAQAQLANPQASEKRIGTPADAIIEPALAAVSGIGASVGAAGASVYKLATAPAGKKAEEADDAAKAIMEKYTYQPRTKIGQAATDVLTYPGKLLSNLGDKAADTTFEKTGSKGLAAAADVAVQGAGQLLGGKLLSKVGGKVRGAEPTPTANPQKAARDYVSQRTSLDFDSLPAGLKSTLTKIAEDSKNLEKLDPKAIERQARLQKLGIPATRGQVTRDLAQLTREENITKSDVGEPIRQVNAAQDKRLFGLIDELRGKTGALAETRQALGKSVQGAERAKLQSLKADKTAKYEAAEKEGASAAPADVTPLREFIKNPTNRRNAPYLAQALNDYAEGDQVSINNLEEIRKEANAYVKKPGPEGYFAKQAVKTIDGILDQSGSETYKTARAANAALKQEFDRQGRIKKLVSEKGYSKDRAVALEDTFDTVVLRGSSEDISNVQKSLLEDNPNVSSKVKGLGTQAWKDLQGATLDYLKEKAAGKRAIRGEDEQLQFNSAFRDAFSELEKDGKIDVLFSKEQAGMLRQIYEAVGDVRTKPSGRIAGSDTIPRGAAMIESLLDKVAKLPIGDLGRGAVQGVKSLREKGRAAKEAQAATRSPIDEAAQAAAPQARKRTGATLQGLGKALQVTPVTLQDTQK